ncbi:MAG: hypothetical protein GTO45_18630, partial [Candidatus Aminicenantes bacterium]|nr:hypothetical protein [Candidatus Aminicenantes bacterium]NIM80805.1 hypothetical protein [Candidatus Aminicenantes bacterium]NIN20188.1 hypothetical protein [Candidatus Aminicenantes bacterium]NIN43967.1 hypothetical protein [Candidatus Aminicenantes bacterium]NIN86776.1 hypothetical protein [Candidatus Aminicenantes bacterium]
MELIAFGVGVNWIAKLYKRLKRIRKKRKKELNEINDIMFGDPLELARYYVEPNCQETNPADRHEEDFLVSSEPIYKKIDEFLRAKKLDQPGNNQMFVLSDAGMGKTSLLAMLKLMHLTSFWPKNNDCVLKKLGKEMLVGVKNIENKRETILLLDALDEDPEAYRRVKERLLEVLKATENFHRVIITCRTQFFPEVEKGPFERPGLISVGGYVCPAKYLSLFNDEKVEFYLNKRFPGKYLLFKPKEKIKKAKEIIEHMGSLRCRPMLLAYIDKLMESPLSQEKINEYKIYNALVDSWLRREEVKTGFPKNELFKSCEILAIEMSIKGERDIAERELDLLIADVSGLKYVKAIDVKGRSLLNKNSIGNYRFSHYSIQEFLLTKHLIENPSINLEKKLKLTDLIAQMLIINCKFKDCHHFFDFDNTIFKNLDIRGVDLHKIERKEKGDFKGADLKGADLKGADLKGAKLMGANLIGANLQETDLQVADLKEVDLKEAKLNRGNLLGANLQGANLQEAELQMSDLSWADLQGANLQGTNFNNANLRGAKLDVTNLRKVKLQGAILQGFDLRGADLKEVDLHKTNLQETNLQGANLHKVNLREANLQRANLMKADLQGADLKGVNLQEANLQEAKLDVNNLKEAKLQ